MKTFILLLASATCCLSAAPAFAETGDRSLTVTGVRADHDTIRVSYRDLNLANANDAGVLRARVKRATMQKCDTLYDGAMLQMSWACRDAAWHAAAPQIAAAIDRARSGQQVATSLVLTLPRPAR